MPAYDRADLGTRFLAFLIDAILCILMALIPKWIGLIPLIVYILVRDGLFKGQSIGKKLLKLRVVQIEEGRPANFLDSSLRNLPLAIPFLGWFILTIVEAIFVLTDEDGIRLGDKLAKTQVTAAEEGQA